MIDTPLLKKKQKIKKTWAVSRPNGAVLPMFDILYQENYCTLPEEGLPEVVPPEAGYP